MKFTFCLCEGNYLPQMVCLLRLITIYVQFNNNCAVIFIYMTYEFTSIWFGSIENFIFYISEPNGKERPALDWNCWPRPATTQPCRASTEEPTRTHWPAFLA